MVLLRNKFFEKSVKAFLCFCCVCFFQTEINSVFAQISPWKKIDEGLFIGRFISPQKSKYGNSEIIVIKIDPEIYSFRLLSAAEQKHENLNARQWCVKYNLIGAINAGMFQADYKSNVGYMKNFEYTNNRRISPSYHSVAAFNPKDSLSPSFRIIDTDVEDIQQIINSYQTVIQNLRLIKAPAQNRWSQQDKKWSEAALGQDKDRNVLFIFSRSPYSMHDFNKILIQLPINIVNAMHLEGGPEASLYFNYKGIEIEGIGSYETNFNENDFNDYPSTLPNVIGFEKRGGISVFN